MWVARRDRPPTIEFSNVLSCFQCRTFTNGVALARNARRTPAEEAREKSEGPLRCPRLELPENPI